MGTVLLQPLTPVWGSFRIGRKNEDAILPRRGESSLHHAPHPSAHTVRHALRNIKSEDPFFLFNLAGYVLRVGETANQQQKNNGSCQHNQQFLSTNPQPEDRQSEQQPEKNRLGKLNIGEQFFHDALRLSHPERVRSGRGLTNHSTSKSSKEVNKR